MTDPASGQGLHAAPRANRSLAGVIDHGYVPEEAAGVIVAWYLAQHGRWEASTLRMYRASLIFRCRSLLTSGMGDADDIKAAIMRLRNERPRPRRGKPRTSAKKRKSAPEQQVRAVRSAVVGNDDLARVLRGLLAHLPRIGLRPCELRAARLEGLLLIVQGAKTTNGRGLAERPLTLTGYNRVDLRSLRRLLDRLRALADDPAMGSWDRLLRRLSERLARACKRARVARISL